MLRSGYIGIFQFGRSDAELNNACNIITLNMSVCMCVSGYQCVQQRNDDEAVVDRGGARSQQGTNFEQEDLEGT